LILLRKINENAALKNMIWRRKPPNETPGAFYSTSNILSPAAAKLNFF